MKLLMLFVVALAVLPVACQQDMHVPVPSPVDTPEGDVPPVLEPKPLPPV